MDSIAEDHSLFEHALDLEWPWYVEEMTIDDSRQRLVVDLEFEAGAVFACGACGKPNCEAYDTIRQQWRHVDFFHYRTFLRGPAPRVNCPSCGVRKAVLPWARMRQRLTLTFEEMVVSLAREMPLRAVGRLVGEHDTRLRRIVEHYRT